MNKGAPRPVERENPRKKSLIEMREFREIMIYVSRIVDSSRSRAKLIFGKKDKSSQTTSPGRGKQQTPVDDYPPILIDKKFYYRETPTGVLVIHEPVGNQHEAQKVVIEMDIREIAAIFLRDSQIISQLTETVMNTRRMLDRTIGTIFTGTKIDARQQDLTSANVRSIEEFLTSTDALYDPILRRVLNILFEVAYVRDKLGKELIRGGQKDVRTTIELSEYVIDALRRRQKEDGDNGIYDLVLRPGISFLGTHNGRSRKINTLDLMLQYLRSTSSTPFEKREMLSNPFLAHQADVAVNDIIGKLSAPKSTRRVKPEISEEIRNNTLYSTNPNLYDSLSALISRRKTR